MPARAFLSSLSDGVRGDAETAVYQGVKVARFQLGPHILLQRCYTKMASDRDFDPEHISQAGGDVECFERDARVWPELLARGLRTAAENGSPVFPARAGWSIGSAGCCRWELSPSYSFHLHWHGDPGEQSCSACLIASLPHWLSAAHCARSDNRSTTRRTTCEPSPPPVGIVGPSFHVKPDRWLLPRALDLHPRLVVDAYWMAITTQWLLVCHRQREPQPDGCGREPTSARHRLLARSSRSVGLRRLDRRDRIVFGYFECRERFVVRRSRRSFRRCQLADLVFEFHPVSNRHGTTVQFDEEIYVVRIAQCICDGVEGEPNAAECVHHQSTGEGELSDAHPVERSFLD